ncbi:unnamed protein product [Pleuronectes platessa]|uniref:Uncharacterized protein n=1 Tax=Pleuronectes platessa TaxID=8262 RepID=A0A9N7YZ83_PLEPL|nr:unnamed protein product [Pleuronectes platessa]
MATGVTFHGPGASGALLPERVEAGARTNETCWVTCLTYFHHAYVWASSSAFLSPHTQARYLNGADATTRVSPKTHILTPAPCPLPPPPLRSSWTPLSVQTRLHH